MLFLEFRQSLVHDGATGTAEDVSDEENAQRAQVLYCR
jgi:hypothetical protein